MSAITTEELVELGNQLYKSKGTDALKILQVLEK
jgi:hypothetical protein